MKYYIQSGKNRIIVSRDCDEINAAVDQCRKWSQERVVFGENIFVSQHGYVDRGVHDGDYIFNTKHVLDFIHKGTW